MGTIAYIVALTSQLTAGAMLLLGSTGISKKKIISSYCEAHRPIHVAVNGNLVNYEEFIEVAKKIWMNKIAFWLLFFGYLLSIFSETPENKWITFGLVIASTVLLLIVLNFFTSVMSKRYGLINIKDMGVKNGVRVYQDIENNEEV